jgi:hypothetical protein
MTIQDKINDLVKKCDNSKTSEQKRNLQILIDNQKAFLQNENKGLNKPQTMKNANPILKSIQNSGEYISHEIVKGSFKGEPVEYIHVYTKKRFVSGHHNQFGLDAFSDSNGRHGLLIDITKSKGLKAPATKGLRTICAQTFSVTGLRRKDGTQKKGFVAKKGGKLVKKTAKKPVAKKTSLNK